MQERAREGGRRERKTFLLPPLFATEAISVARRREERGEERAGEIKSGAILYLRKRAVQCRASVAYVKCVLGEQVVDDNQTNLSLYR